MTERTSRLFLLCALLSGAAALIYEVVWSRMLVLAVGGTRPAVAAVLAAFMGGLAIGSALGGRAADRAARPLRLYAVLEVAIGAAGLASGPAIGWIETLGATAGGPARFALCLAVVALPAALIGATFPAMVRAAAAPGAVGRSVSLLYAVNTLGGMAGTLGAGFALIPALGMAASLWVAAAGNALAAALAWILSEAPAAPAAAEEPSAPVAWGRPAAAAAATGFLSLAFEVVWTRVLVLMLGGSVYAFSIMLGGFLAGIAAGGFVAARVRVLPAAAIAVALAFSALLNYGWFALIGLPFRLLASWREAMPDSFWGFSAARFALTAALLSAVTVPMGMVFPLLVAMVHRRFGRLGREAGGVYAANTAGAVAGSLAGGLVLLPALGLHGTMGLLSGGCLLLAAAFAWTALPPGRARPAWAAGAVVLAAIAATAFPRPDPRLLSSGVFLYTTALREKGFDSIYRYAPPLFYEEGASASVAVMQEEGHRFLRINGKTDAGTSDEATQLLLGHLPMLLHPKPESVLVIGYGAGGSLGAVTRHPEARRILCAEIEPAVLKAAGFFDERYGRPRSDPRVRVVVEDGRLLCRSLSERFDVIVSEPSNPWLTGVSNLFTVEFYRLLRARLALGGLAVVWIPMYHGTAADARTALGTVREVFPEATLWVVGGADALLIAPADGPLRLDPGRIDGAIGAHERVRADLNGIGIDGWHALVDRLTMDASALKAFARDAPLNTDDRPILEFGLPRTMRPGHRQVEMLEEVYRYYHRPGPRPPADLVIPFARAEAMGVRCRPDGRDAPIRFAGIVRSFRPIRPRPDAPVGIEAQTVSLLSVKTGDGPLEVRSYRRPSIGRRELLATLAGLGVPDPFVETVSDHEAVGGLAGAFGVISWYCPKKGAQLEALLGPPAPAPGWLERMGLACAHDPN